MEKVNLKKCKIPKDYHCNCTFCKKFGGLLIREDGIKYSKLERRKYYSPVEITHIAKTPLHLARWAIQTYSKPNDWVLDPTLGAGTTAVEALREGRNTAGVELQFFDVIVENILINNPHKKKHVIRAGDARNLKKFFKRKFDLVINNPPYSGDERQKGWKMEKATYDHSLNNLAHLKENEEYWMAIEDIFLQCAHLMRKGARFILGVKDMMRNKKLYPLHNLFGDILADFLTFEQMVLLPHYPPTLFMNTYQKRWPEVKLIPRYQTILVFKKDY
jgi:DNA modification methylase